MNEHLLQSTEIEENVRESREEAIIGKWRNHFVLHKKEGGKVDHRKKSFSSRGSTLNTLLSYVAYK